MEKEGKGSQLLWALALYAVAVLSITASLAVSRVYEFYLSFAAFIIFGPAVAAFLGLIASRNPLRMWRFTAAGVIWMLALFTLFELSQLLWSVRL